ncbi:hypothetical protein N7G274_008816 [Stereocaulon virgatum]|uniref:CUB domain-containing protein n=1 Tax=Stereocaulon virgatum TaxID=373712 RepID=A0ABR4A290_9LECA
MMCRKGPLLAIAALCCHTNPIVLALVKSSVPQVPYLTSVSQSPNLTVLPPFASPQQSAKVTFVPDPYIFNGPMGIYRFSRYTGSLLTFEWAATFFYMCLGDIFNAIATQNHQPFDPYPNGVYECEKTIPTFHDREIVFCQLVLHKVDAPIWDMTFYDIVQDLQAIWFAALHFRSEMFGLPSMNVEVHRYVEGLRGTFLAETGAMLFMMRYFANNVSVT